MKEGRNTFYFLFLDIVVEGKGLAGNQMAALSGTRFLSGKERLTSLLGYREICRKWEVLFQSEQLTVLSDCAHRPREVTVLLE